MNGKCPGVQIVFIRNMHPGNILHSILIGWGVAGLGLERVYKIHTKTLCSVVF